MLHGGNQWLLGENCLNPDSLAYQNVAQWHHKNRHRLLCRSQSDGATTTRRARTRQTQEAAWKDASP
jgi:hypothetical protein